MEKNRGMVTKKTQKKVTTLVKKPQQFEWLGIFGWGMLLLLILAGAFAAVQLSSLGSLSSVLSQVQPTAQPTPVPTPEPPKSLSVLLMGYGGGGHDGGKLTDSIIIAHVNPITKLITLVSVPRDLWVPLPLTADNLLWSKINAAYAIGEDQNGYQNREDQYKGEHGGGELAKHVVGQVVGFQPDLYAAIDFATFIKGIDIIGPLSVKVPYTFDDFFYPIRGYEDESCGYSETDIATITATFKDFELEKQFPCRYEQLHFDKGVSVMDGETALKFVRSRHSGTGGGDFGRSERQQALIQAVIDKVFSLSFIPKIAPLAQQLSAGVNTDFPISSIPEYLSNIGNPSEYKIHTITLTTSNVLQDGRSANRQYILRPREGEGNWSGIQAFIQQEMFAATQSAELDATPSATPN